MTPVARGDRSNVPTSDRYLRVNKRVGYQDQSVHLTALWQGTSVTHVSYIVYAQSEIPANANYLLHSLCEDTKDKRKETIMHSSQWKPQPPLRG